MLRMKRLFINFFLWYLRIAARIQLFKIKPKIIALTGSAGKTSLRNAIFSVLKDNFKCKQSIKANSETGIPLDLLDLYPRDYSWLDWLRLSLLIPWQLLFNWQKYDYYIVELGVDDPFPPKNMGYLLSFIKPDISIFLNVSLVHTMQFEKLIKQDKKFKSIDDKRRFLVRAIAKEKGRIITTLGKNKIGIINADDPLVLAEARKSKAKIYYFGRKRGMRIKGYKISSGGTSFKYQHQDRRVSLKLSYLLPEYYSYTFGAALLSGKILGLSLKQAVDAIEKNFIIPPGRMGLFKGIKNTTIIDSSYNASEVSTLGALDLLNKAGKQKEKIFVFGDMRELGTQAKIEHQQVAKKVLKVVDRLILIGPLTKKHVLPLVSSKIRYSIVPDKINTKWFKNSWLVGDWLKKNLKGGEIILIKGSQNTIFTEIVVEALLANKKDKSKLCRRGRFWDRQRRQSEV